LSIFICEQFYTEDLLRPRPVINVIFAANNELLLQFARSQTDNVLTAGYRAGMAGLGAGVVALQTKMSVIPSCLAIALAV
jgi:hypothetical protein